jgi:hypothetical protein
VRQVCVRQDLFEQCAVVAQQRVVAAPGDVVIAELATPELFLGGGRRRWGNSSQIARETPGFGHGVWVWLKGGVGSGQTIQRPAKLSCSRPRPSMGWSTAPRARAERLATDPAHDLSYLGHGKRCAGKLTKAQPKMSVDNVRRLLPASRAIAAPLESEVPRFRRGESLRSHCKTRRASRSVPIPATTATATRISAGAPEVGSTPPAAQRPSPSAVGSSSAVSLQDTAWT